MSRNIHKRNLECVAVVHWLFHTCWLLKEPFVSLSVYQQILLYKSFKWLIFTLLEQLNNNLQGISISPQSCFQWCLWPVISTHMFSPCLIKYHKICEYLQGKWPTRLFIMTSFMASLSKFTKKCMAIRTLCSCSCAQKVQVIMARCRTNLQTSRVLFSFLKQRNWFFSIKMERKNINQCLGGLGMEGHSEWSPQTSLQPQREFWVQIADLKLLPGLKKTKNGNVEY